MVALMKGTGRFLKRQKIDSFWASVYSELEQESYSIKRLLVAYVKSWVEALLAK